MTFGCMPAGMELFPAANDSQWNFIKSIIDESDYYLIIVGGKYGSIHPGSGISYTRMEYEYATSINKPILRFLAKDIENLPHEKREKDPKISKKLLEFRNLLTADNLCSFYRTPDQLALQVTHGMRQLIERYPAVGWMPANQLSKLVERADEVVDYDEVKTQLEKIVIYKMLNLETIEETQPVIYEKYIPRLKKKIKVSSEVMAIKINRFEKKVNHFKSRDRTNGDAIEVSSFLPFKLHLGDGDMMAKHIEPIIMGPSNVYVLSGHMYNGFKNGELDLGIKAEKNTKTARLIIDLSSIPGINEIIPKPPRLFHRRLREDSDVSSAENLEDVELFEYDIIAPGIFCAEIHDIKKEEGFRFEFSVDIDSSSANT